MALVETIENQGVLVRVTLLYPPTTRATSSSENTLNLPSFRFRNSQAVEGGWRLEVGLVVTGLGLLLHWLVGGVVMPFR